MTLALGSSARPRVARRALDARRRLSRFRSRSPRSSAAAARRASVRSCAVARWVDGPPLDELWRARRRRRAPRAHDRLRRLPAPPPRGRASTRRICARRTCSSRARTRRFSCSSTSIASGAIAGSRGGAGGRTSCRCTARSAAARRGARACASCSATSAHPRAGRAPPRRRRDRRARPPEGRRVRAKRRGAHARRALARRHAHERARQAFRAPSSASTRRPTSAPRSRA